MSTPPAPDAPRRTLLVDGHSLAYRAFHALPVENFATSTGQPTNAVYGFTSMLLNLLRDERPDRVAVAFDVSRHSFRTDEYPEYKGTRAASPPEFSGQVGLVKEVLAALRVTVLEKPGYEADDVIATLARTAREAGDEVLVSSGDRDAVQLVGPTVTLLYPLRGVSETLRLTPEAALERFGVVPERYPDLAALVGEKSDNLPGVPGVGAKTAAKWLDAHGDLAGIVAAAPSIRGKAGENLRAHLDDVLRNRRLNRLVDDLELPVALDDLDVRPWDDAEVDRVFDALQFRALRDRLAALRPDVPGGEVDVPAVEVALDEPGDLAGWLAEHAAAGAGVHVTGSWARGRGDVEEVAVASPDGRAVRVDVAAAGPVALDALAAWLADPDRPKVLHDAKGPLTALADRGLPLAGLRGDTALAAYLCHPDQRSYELGDLCRRHLGRELPTEGPDAGQLALDTGGDPTAGAVRARAVLELSAELDAELERRGARRLLDEVELPLVRVLVAMERTGIAVDPDALAALEKRFAAEVEQAAADARAQVEGGDELNLSSPKQLQVVLFEQLGLPRTKKIKTGYTTDAEALADLLARTDHPFLRHLLRHRDVIKLRQTVEGLRRSVSDDGRVHTTFQQTIAATGRLSSTDPNLQNIPVRTEEGRLIRDVFVVGAGHETLLTADYSQIEMRIMAHLSQDAGLVEAFRTGEDLHRFVGARVFDVDPADVTPAMRSKIKAMSYGLAYGLSAFGLARQLTVPVAEARQLMGDYFARFGGVREYLLGVVEEARRTGYTETVLGRRRYLPDLASDNRQRREMAERMALNAPIQGSAADVVKVAMLRADAALREAGLRSRLLLQVHDELVVEVAPGEADRVEELVRGAMSGAAELRVPLDVQVGRGRSWHDAAH